MAKKATIRKTNQPTHRDAIISLAGQFGMEPRFGAAAFGEIMKMLSVQISDAVHTSLSMATLTQWDYEAVRAEERATQNRPGAPQPVLDSCIAAENAVCDYLAQAVRESGAEERFLAEVRAILADALRVERESAADLAVN